MFEKDTLAIIGEGECAYEDSVAPPIFQTSTFGGGNEYSYSRLSNPTRTALEKVLATLENGKHAFAFSSGLAAINAVFSLFKSGDKILLSDDLYGGTYRIAANIFKNHGISFEFCDMSDAKALEPYFSSETAAVFAESPTNPMMNIADLVGISRLCREKGTLFIVDNTFLTPYFQNPLALGADIVLHSATKYLSGHHDAVAGAVVVSDDALSERLSLISGTLGNALSPFDSFLVLRGIRTLGLRMERHQRNAFAVSEYLSTHKKVERVIFPGLKSHKGHLLCASQARGYGGVVSFVLKDTSGIDRLLKGGCIIKFAESLGGFRSLITYPLTQTHASIPKDMRDRIGISDRLLRLSLGLEDERDIIADLAELLE